MDSDYGFAVNKVDVNFEAMASIVSIPYWQHKIRVNLNITWQYKVKDRWFSFYRFNQRDDFTFKSYKEFKKAMEFGNTYSSMPVRILINNITLAQVRKKYHLPLTPEQAFKVFKPCLYYDPLAELIFKDKI